MTNQEIYPGIVLWMSKNQKHGGCLAALDGESYLFGPIDRREHVNPETGQVASCTAVYAAGFIPKSGDPVLFSIEFKHFSARQDYRVTSIAPLADGDCSIEDTAALQKLFDDYEWTETMKRGERRPFQPRVQVSSIYDR
jgi:hypothetical protein